MSHHPRMSFSNQLSCITTGFVSKEVYCGAVRLPSEGPMDAGVRVHMVGFSTPVVSYTLTC